MRFLTEAIFTVVPPSARFLQGIACLDHKNILRAVPKLSQSFALALPHEEAEAIRDAEGYFQGLAKNRHNASAPGAKTD